MVYFISQLAIFIAVALGIGIVVGYLIWSDPEDDEEEAASGSELKELSDLRGRVVALESERSDLAADLEQRMLDLDTRTSEVSQLRADLADVSSRYEARGSQLAAMRVSQEELQSLLASDAVATNWNAVESRSSRPVAAETIVAAGAADLAMPAPAWARSTTRDRADDVADSTGVEFVDTGFAPAAYTSATPGVESRFATTLVDHAPGYGGSAYGNDAYDDDAYVDDASDDDAYVAETDEALASAEPSVASPGFRTDGYHAFDYVAPGDTPFEDAASDQMISGDVAPSDAGRYLSGEYVSPPLVRADDAALGGASWSQPHDEADDYTDDVATYELYDPDQWTRSAGADAYAARGVAPSPDLQIVGTDHVDELDELDDPEDDQDAWTEQPATPAAGAPVPGDEYEPSWEEEWVDPSSLPASPGEATDVPPTGSAQWPTPGPSGAADPLPYSLDLRTSPPPPPPPAFGREDVLRPSDWAPWPQADAGDDDAPSSEWFTQPAPGAAPTAVEFDRYDDGDAPDEPTLDQLLRTGAEESSGAIEVGTADGTDEADAWKTGWTDSWADEGASLDVSAAATEAAPAAWEWTRSAPIEAPAVGGWPEETETAKAPAQVEQPGWAGPGIAALPPPPPVPQLPPAPAPAAHALDLWRVDADDDIDTAEPSADVVSAATFEPAGLEPVEFETAEFETAEFETAEFESTGAVSAEADTAELDTAELDTAELDTAELDTVELDTAELDTADLDTVLTDHEAPPSAMDTAAPAPSPAPSAAPSVDVAMAALQAQLDELRRLVVSSTAPMAVEPALSAPEAADLVDMAWDDFSDDLTLLPGSSEEMARHLNEIGVTTYQEIGEWGPADAAQYQAWLSDYPGIIERMGWVSAAQRLWQQTNRKPWTQRTRQDL